jgi:hypothetical protein
MEKQLRALVVVVIPTKDPCLYTEPFYSRMGEGK